MKDKANKANIERIALIIGTVLGVIAFFWQVFDSIDKQREKIRIGMTYAIPHEDLPIDLSIEIINYGQRPVYIKSVLIHEVLSKSFWGTPKGTVSLLVFADDKNQADPIQPGQSREYKEQVNYQDIKEWLESTNQINVTIQSPVKLLLTRDIKECLSQIEYWVKYAKERMNSDSPFYFGCTP